jgi:putative ABC transport system substrate-binding protein
MTPFGSAATIAAKSATTTIPIVFAVDDDPVRLGLVAGLARPNGNLTGLNFFATELAEKRLELLRELVPTAARVAVLVNPTYPNAEPTVRDVTTAAHARGLQIEVHNASTSQEINAVFASLARDRPGALFVAGDPLFVSRRIQMILLATRLAIPASYSGREFPDAGGLMSYGTNIAEAWRQTGAYAGRVLKGAKPADLPVVRSSKFELVINAETARMLGLTVPPTLLATADEVIE